MIYYAQAVLLLLTLWLGARDGLTNKMYTVAKLPEVELNKMQDQWHRMGFEIYMLACVALVYFTTYWLSVACLLIRFSFYNIAYNLFAGMPLGYIGKTAKTDKIVRSILGGNASVVMAIAGLVLLIGLNVLYGFIHRG